ncbi:hypothetical protein GCM10010103_37490 [Streptomyces paradoxus]
MQGRIGQHVGHLLGVLDTQRQQVEPPGADGLGGEAGRDRHRFVVIAGVRGHGLSRSGPAGEVKADERSLIGPLLLAAGAVELFATDLPWAARPALLGAVGLLLAFRKPVGVRGMVWGLSQDRLWALTTHPEAELLSTGQNVLFLSANAIGTTLGLLGADRLFSSLG